MTRPAQLADVERMVEIAASSATAAHWPHEAYLHALRGGEPRRLVLVAEEGGDTCGLLLALRQTVEWELENIVVAEATRGRGHGRALLTAMLDAARAEGAECVFLEVRISNQAARKLYEAAGFEQAGTRKSYYDNPLEDAAVYRKNL